MAEKMVEQMVDSWAASMVAWTVELMAVLKDAKTAVRKVVPLVDLKAAMMVAYLAEQKV